MKFTPEIIKKLPKAELHCHLDGSLRIDTILRLALEQGVKLPSNNKSILESILVVKDNIGSLENFNGVLEGVENTNYKIRTNKGLYILTLYEKRVDKKDIPFFLELMFYLSNEKIQCPLPLKNRNGKLFDELNSRPASILTFLEGSSTETIYPKQVNTLGKILAKIHILGKQLKIKRKNPLSLGNLESLITLSKKNSENIRNDLSKEIVSEYYRVRSNWPDNLPKGIIHADLFPDNVLFIGNEISGVIDFCFSCNDFLSYDLATCLNAWCFDKEGILDLNLSSELINGYQSLRKLEENEINFFLKTVPAIFENSIFLTPPPLSKPNCAAGGKF